MDELEVLVELVWEDVIKLKPTNHNEVINTIDTVCVNRTKDFVIENERKAKVMIGKFNVVNISGLIRTLVNLIKSDLYRPLGINGTTEMILDEIKDIG